MGMPSEHERAVTVMWDLARTSGISRRRYLQLISVGGAAAVLAACSGQRLPRSGGGPSADGVNATLAYGLNGEPLPSDHGYPLRAVVPGWVGSSWIKWIGRIVVSSQPSWTRNNTTSYVVPFNEKGYLFNQPLPHPVSVA